MVPSFCCDAFFSRDSDHRHPFLVRRGGPTASDNSVVGMEDNRRESQSLFLGQCNEF